mgnify:CR=1 FL=1
MFGNPWALLLLLLAAPIVWLYRRPTVFPVVSTAAGTIWQQVLAEQGGRTRWLRYRRFVSLALQLVILTLTVLAAAQPRLSRPKTWILVLDNSGSMEATDVEPSRFEVARWHAQRFIGSAGQDDRVGIVTGGTPLGVVCTPTQDRRQLLDALLGMNTAAGATAVPEAIALARTMLDGNSDGRVIVLSDACFEGAADVATAEDVELYTVGGAAANVAVRRVAARREPAAPDTSQVLVEVASHPALAVREIPLAMEFNGAPVERSPAGQKADGTTFELGILPTGDQGKFSVMTEYEDVLPADNRGSTQVPPARIRGVVVVGSFDKRLATAFQADPHVRISEVGVAPEKTQPGVILALQGSVPERLPDCPLLVVNPQNGCDWWDVDGVIEHARIARQAIDFPILAGVDLEGIVLSQVGRVAMKPPQGGDVHVLAASADDEPLLLAFERPAGRVVVLGGDPGVSELYQQMELPVLLTQAIAWLGGDDSHQDSEMIADTGAVFAASESDLQVPPGVGVPADKWEIPRPSPPLWLFCGALALILVVLYWCLYQRRWTS